MSCAYCGSIKERAWQGAVAWCGSDRCNLLHDWDTYEPNFQVWMEPTPLQCFAGWLWFLALRVPTALIPIRWCAIERKETWRYDLIYWFLSRSYWACERAGGRA